jgi:hypothetical protein
MFFCYTDESGDTGAFNASEPEKSGTEYFILRVLLLRTEGGKKHLIS